MRRRGILHIYPEALGRARATTADLAPAYRENKLILVGDFYPALAPKRHPPPSFNNGKDKSPPPSCGVPYSPFLSPQRKERQEGEKPGGEPESEHRSQPDNSQHIAHSAHPQPAHSGSNSQRSERSNTDRSQDPAQSAPKRDGFAIRSPSDFCAYHLSILAGCSKKNRPSHLESVTVGP